MSGTIYVPAARLISSVAELYDNSVETIYVEGGNIEEQIKYLLNNNGMEDDLTAMDIASLVGGGIGVTLIFVSGLGGKVAAIIMNATGTALSVAGAATVLDKMFNLLEKYGFERACRDGNLNISSSHYVSAVLGNVWDPWDTEFYINKISVNGDIGTVEKNITNKDIIDWFGWERTDHNVTLT